jgi:hypothetical protein
MSELVACSLCKCLMHETRSIGNVEISIRVQGKTVRDFVGSNFCQDCFSKLVKVVPALSPSDQGTPTVQRETEA